MRNLTFYCILLLFMPLFIWGEKASTSKKIHTSEVKEMLDSAYQDALLKYRKGEFEDSLNIIREVIELDIYYYKLRYLAGQNYLKQNNYTNALSHFKTCIKIAPLVPFPYLSLVSLHISKKRYDLAEKVLNKYYQSVQSEGSAPYFQIYLAHAKVYLYNKRYKKALRMVELAKSEIELYNMHSYFISVLLLEGRIYLVKKEYDKSEVSLLWALELSPHNLEIKVLLSYLYYQWGSSLRKKGNDFDNYQAHYASALEYTDVLLSSTLSSQKQKENVQLVVDTIKYFDGNTK